MSSQNPDFPDEHFMELVDAWAAEPAAVIAARGRERAHEAAAAARGERGPDMLLVLAVADLEDRYAQAFVAEDAAEHDMINEERLRALQSLNARIHRIRAFHRGLPFEVVTQPDHENPFPSTLESLPNEGDARASAERRAERGFACEVRRIDASGDTEVVFVGVPLPKEEQLRRDRLRAVAAGQLYEVWTVNEREQHRDVERRFVERRDALAAAEGLAGDGVSAMVFALEHDGSAHLIAAPRAVVKAA